MVVSNGSLHFESNDYDNQIAMYIQMWKSISVNRFIYKRAFF